MKKRILAWVIALSMLLGQVPVYAAELTAETMEEEESSVIYEIPEESESMETTAEYTETEAEETEAESVEETTAIVLEETVEFLPEAEAAAALEAAELAAPVPENIRWDGYILSWDYVSGQEDYRCRIHYADELWAGSESVVREVSVNGHCTNMTIPMMEMAMMSLPRTGSRDVDLLVEVMAVGDVCSDWVEAPVYTYTLGENVQQLDAPSRVSWTDDTILSWNTVKGATGYELIVSTAVGSKTLEQQSFSAAQTSISVDLKDTLDSMGEEYFRDTHKNVMDVTVAVSAKDDYLYYAGSRPAASSVQKYTLAGYKVLDKVTNVRWDNYILRWNSVTGAERYELEVVFGEGDRAFTRTLETASLSMNLTDILREMCDGYGCMSEPTKTPVYVKVSAMGTNSISGSATASPALTLACPMTVRGNTIRAEGMTLDCSAKTRKIALGAAAEGGAALTYKTSTSKVSVTKTGIVSIPARFVGTATITITSAATEVYSKTEKQIKIVVNPVITVSDKTISASSVAKTYSLGVKTLGKATLSYTSNNENATIEPKGKIKVAPFTSGSADITVRADGAGGTFAEKIIHVEITPLVDNTITMANDSFTRTYTGKAQTFCLDAVAGGEAKLSYKTSTGKVKVSKSGKVTIDKKFLGTATITITSAETSKYYSASRTVELTMVPGENVIKVKGAVADTVVKAASSKGRSFSLGISVLGKANVTCSIKSASVAGISVSDKGKVTIPAGYAGNAVIHIHAAETYGFYATDRDITVDVRPGVPTMRVTNPAEGVLEVKWSAVPTATYYVIRVGENKDNIEFGGTYIEKRVEDPKELAAKTTQIASRSFGKGKTCYVQIEAVNKNGSTVIASAWSKVYAITITK